MKRKKYIGVIFLVLCSLTGCERMEHGPAANLPQEATEMWIKEVQAEAEIVVAEVEDAMADVEMAIGEAESVIAEAEQMMAELAQESTKESLQETTASEALGTSGTMEALPESTAGSQNVPEPAEAPQPEVYEFTHSEKDYFSDALFIGDSRTVGLQLYGTLDNADYFAEPGLSLYSIPRTKLDVGEHKKIALTELLEEEVYGKIYLMLGINELGYNFDTTLERYHALVTEIRTKQPEAVLYVCANLHVTNVRNTHDEIHNNANINKMNAKIEELADGQDIFYLDANVLFDDEVGNLNDEIASDDSHVQGAYYDDWCNWLGENTIVK